MHAAFRRAAAAVSAALVLLITNATLNAETRFAGVFGDHMVLQRYLAAPVWGWNLVNGAGLPAAPFRTDTWDVTQED